MNLINVRRFGFALGAAFAVLYLGCAFVMATVPHEAALRFFNSWSHTASTPP